MKIKSVRLNRFRSYENSVRFELEDLSVLVGRNDIGKSTVLEALDIFFNEGKGCVKLDKDDINKACLERDEDTIEIEVEFVDLPQSIIIDTAYPTTLADEYLLSSDGTLRILKKYPQAGKEKVFVCANHPQNPNCADLLLKKIGDLRSILNEQGLQCDDLSKKAEIRKAIWNGQDDLMLGFTEIDVSKIEEKDIWARLKSYMPMYTLFQADRKNSDSDTEVQDPMKIAIKEIFSDVEIQERLNYVAETVRQKLKAVADRTLEKLKDLNPTIAASLNPQVPDSDDLKWVDVFKNVSIAGDDIPINKRGSGVKRLVLLSFFRAEAERRQADNGLSNVIYAIEEPETSQHPNHQRALIDALIDLSKIQNTQVMLTTHSPEIVKKLNFENILLLNSDPASRIKKVERNELPYPSLNEVNFLAFGEASCEYHNELYGFIEAEERLSDYRDGKRKIIYKKIQRNGAVVDAQITMTEYIRHQIHHPENQYNDRFSESDLTASIEAMRCFIREEELEVVEQ